MAAAAAAEADEDDDAVEPVILPVRGCESKLAVKDEAREIRGKDKLLPKGLLLGDIKETGDCERLLALELLFEFDAKNTLDWELLALSTV